MSKIMMHCEIKIMLIMVFNSVLQGYKQYTYIKLYKNNRYLQYLLEYVPHSSGYNN